MQMIARRWSLWGAAWPPRHEQSQPANFHTRLASQFESMKEQVVILIDAQSSMLETHVQVRRRWVASSGALAQGAHARAHVQHSPALPTRPTARAFQVRC